MARSPLPWFSIQSYLPQYDSSAFDVNATRSYRLVSSTRKYDLNSGVTAPKIVTPVWLLEPLRVNVHNIKDDKEELQFNRSRVPGITVVVSGVRVNSPSDPIKLNETIYNLNDYRLRKFIISYNLISYLMMSLQRVGNIPTISSNVHCLF